MEVDVLLFGPLARAAGRDRVSLSFDASRVSVDDVRRGLHGELPDLAGQIESCRFAVNHSFAEMDDAVVASDEVALIGFVAGG